MILSLFPSLTAAPSHVPREKEVLQIEAGSHTTGEVRALRQTESRLQRVLGWHLGYNWGGKVSSVS